MDFIWWKYSGTIQRNVHRQPHFDIQLIAQKKRRVCKILLKNSQNQQKDELKRKKKGK